MLELAEKVIAMTGSSSRIVHCPLPADDPSQRRPDIALAKEELDWEPQIALDDGVGRTIIYFNTSIKEI